MHMLCRGMLFATALAPALPALAQQYPSKPIEFVVHTGPGGGADLLARVIADAVAKQKLLPQPLIVQNRAGGGGAIAQTYVAGKRGDPYVLYAAAVTVVASVPVRTGTDVGHDRLQFLGVIGVDPNALTVSADSPYRSVQDLVNAAKANPKSITIAVGSIGATAHYFVHRLEQVTGARFNVIATKSGADAAVQVMGGHVQATAENVAEVMPHVESKRLRVIAVPTSKRLSRLPDAPTLKEAGWDIEAGSGRAIASPAGIPRDAAAVLEDMVAKVYKSAPWQEYMARNMYEEIYLNAEDATRYVAARQGEIAKFLTDVGLAVKK